MGFWGFGVLGFCGREIALDVSPGSFDAESD